jgi:hypothetical protein
MRGQTIAAADALAFVTVARQSGEGSLKVDCWAYALGWTPP